MSSDRCFTVQPAHALSDAWQVLGKLELFGDLNEKNKNALRYWSEQVFVCRADRI